MREDLTTAGDVHIVAGRVAEALGVPLHFDGAPVDLRGTIGTATSTGADEPGALLVAANRDMARARSRRA